MRNLLSLLLLCVLCNCGMPTPPDAAVFDGTLAEVADGATTLPADVGATDAPATVDSGVMDAPVFETAMPPLEASVMDVSGDIRGDGRD